MRLCEILTEGRDADLYHGVDFFDANKIYKTGLMPATTDAIHSFLPQSYKGASGTVSFSRHMPVSRWFANENEEFGVIFVVDQSKLYRAVGKRMRPHEYEVNYDPDDPEGLRSFRSKQESEHEEMVYGDISNFMSYVKQIIIFIPKGMTTRETLSEIKEYAIFHDPKTIVVRSNEPNLTGRQFMKLLTDKPKTKIDTSKIKKPKQLY